MLTRLLTLIQEGDLHTTGELAAAMGVSQGLVAAMVDDLCRRGHLIPTAVSGSPSCGSCPLKATCGPLGCGRGEARLYALMPRHADGGNSHGPARRTAE
ncbi:MAG: MarR family winged helix-turn-helix transcriptional regulator [Chloroflexota bacterium]